MMNGHGLLVGTFTTTEKEGEIGGGTHNVITGQYLTSHQNQTKIRGHHV